MYIQFIDNQTFYLNYDFNIKNYHKLLQPQKNIVKIQRKENIDFDQIDKNCFKDLNFNNPTK